MLKAIHAQEDAQAAGEKAQQVVEKLKAMKLARAAEIVAAGGSVQNISHFLNEP
jgi:hypothetical protein